MSDDRDIVLPRKMTLAGGTVMMKDGRKLDLVLDKPLVLQRGARVRLARRADGAYTVVEVRET